MATCEHLQEATGSEVADPADLVCEDCLQCGHVRCCDSSPRRHASAHHRASGHPVVRSVEPREHWRWCFVDELVG